MWNLIVSVPDHCLSFYFTNVNEIFSVSALDQQMVRPNAGIYY